MKRFMSSRIKRIALLCFVIASLVLLSGTGVVISEPENGDSGPSDTWFAELEDITLMVPPTNKFGVPTGAPDRRVGSEAVAVFDADMDGRPDIALIAGDFYFIALNREGDSGNPTFSPTRYLIGSFDDMKRYAPACFGLHDFNNDGALDLYLSNRGKGTLVTADCNPHDRGLYYSPEYSTMISAQDGTFHYEDLGINGDGNKKTVTFDDFDGDGNFDAHLSVSPYYGPYWPQSESPNQLYPGTDQWNAFGPDIIGDMVVNAPEQFWFDEDGKGIIDFKGVVIRDFDGDGKPDIVMGAYADIWNPACFPTLDTTLPGTEGYQGDWLRGIFVFKNISTPGNILFEDVSNTAIENAYGKTDQMHVYSTVPVDINNNGKLDLIVTGVRNFTAHNSEDYMVDIIRVYRNDSVPGEISFTDITDEVGLGFMNDNDQLPGMYEGGFTRTVFGREYTLVPQMHAAAAIDIDNDGYKDFVAVDRQLLDFDPNTGQPLPLALFVFKNNGGESFTLIDPDEHGLKGLAIDLSYGDFNGDGRIDIVTAGASRGGLMEYPKNNYVYLNNVENDNNYIIVDFDLEGHNKLGIGAKVTVYRTGTTEILGYDEVRTDFSYGSKKEANLHFGLGDAEEVDLQIEVPNGPSGKLVGLPANQTHTVKTLPSKAADLMAGQHIDAGDVLVGNDGTNLYVTFAASEPWKIIETHLHVATDIKQIPQTRRGNPIPGRFTYSGAHELAGHVTYTIPLNSWVPNTELFIAAHAVVAASTNCCDIEEGAWGRCDDNGGTFEGANWATWFIFNVK